MFLEIFLFLSTLWNTESKMSQNFNKKIKYLSQLKSSTNFRRDSWRRLPMIWKLNSGLCVQEWRYCFFCCIPLPPKSWSDDDTKRGTSSKVLKISTENSPEWLLCDIRYNKEKWRFSTRFNKFMELPHLSAREHCII